MERVLNLSLIRANRRRFKVWTIPFTKVTPRPAEIELGDVVFETADVFLDGEIELKNLQGKTLENARI